MSPTDGLKFSVSFVFEVEILVKGYIKLTQEIIDTETVFDIVISVCRVVWQK